MYTDSCFSWWFIFEDSNTVLYINRGGWTTQRLLVQGWQSLWRRRKLK